MIFLGAAGENLIRLSPNGYIDNISIPSGACTPEQIKLGTCPFPAEFSGTGSNRPNARVISNVLLRQVRKRNLFFVFVSLDAVYTSDVEFV